jgi:hypothetical protein
MLISLSAFIMMNLSFMKLIFALLHLFFLFFFLGGGGGGGGGLVAK